MIIDTSALAAVLFKEPERDVYLKIIDLAEECRVSAANFLELLMVTERRIGPSAKLACQTFFDEAEIVVEPVTMEHALLAHQAFLDFGKGRHPAGLNFGDCFAYALAKATGEPLLFKGEDFGRTDLILAR